MHDGVPCRMRKQRTGNYNYKAKQHLRLPAQQQPQRRQSDAAPESTAAAETTAAAEAQWQALMIFPESPSVSAGNDRRYFASDYEEQGSTIERFNKGNDAIQALLQGKD